MPRRERCDAGLHLLIRLRRDGGGNTLGARNHRRRVAA